MTKNYWVLLNKAFFGDAMLCFLAINVIRIVAVISIVGCGQQFEPNFDPQKDSNDSLQKMKIQKKSSFDDKLSKKWSRSVHEKDWLNKLQNVSEAACVDNIERGCLRYGMLLSSFQFRGCHNQESMCEARCKQGENEFCWFLATELLSKLKCKMGACVGPYSGGTTLFQRESDSEKIGNQKARRAFQKACEKKEPLGCLYLGNMWADGKGGIRNSNVALGYMEISCAFGSGDGCMSAGMDHFRRGDSILARTFFQKGCNLGCEDCCNEPEEPPALKKQRDTRVGH